VQEGGGARREFMTGGVGMSHVNGKNVQLVM
jgi:hypothetical protein